MTPAFTVILPHLRNPGNDAALSICLDCLMANTVNEFTLLIDTRTDLPLHAIVNRMVAQAKTEAVLYLASDTFFAPDWDVPMLALFEPDTFVTPVLVEPGVIGMHPENVQRDFGRRPDTFKREMFETWCASDAKELNLTGEGWYAPVLYPRSGFRDIGGLELGLPGDHHGFTSADVQLFEAWKAAGNRVVRARDSYAYHMQRYSQIDEQEHPKRFQGA